MASFNRVILLGNLTRGIELKYAQSGTVIANFSLAVNDSYKDKDGNRKDKPCFVDITAFGRTAEVASEYLSKGSQALVEGRLVLEQWEKDGQKRSKLSVTCDRLQLLGSKPGENQQQDRQMSLPGGDEEPAFNQAPVDCPF